MKKPIKTVTALALSATLMAITLSQGEHADQDHSKPEKIPLSFVNFSANNSSATASTGWVVVQNAIADADCRVTPLKTPETIQG